jgi:hypothetical protein
MRLANSTNDLSIEPATDPDLKGGRVVVTRFECGRLWSLLLILFLHYRVKRDVRRNASGLIGATKIVDWRTRCLLSISLWKDLESIYSMGHVKRHIVATRVPGHIGVLTTSGIYSFAGDWRHVMFGSNCEDRSPLFPLRTTDSQRQETDGQRCVRRESEVARGYSDR